MPLKNEFQTGVGMDWQHVIITWRQIRILLSWQWLSGIIYEIYLWIFVFLCYFAHQYYVPVETL